MLHPNPEALRFLANRQSRSAKMMTAPAPTEAEVMALLTLAVRVPDHGALTPWRFVLAERPGLARLADLAEARAKELGGDAEKIAKGRGQFDRGLSAVVVIGSPRAAAKVPEMEQVLSAGAVCLGLLNAAEAAGWAANWLSGWVAQDRGFVEAAFGLAPQEFVAGIIYLGTPSGETPPRPRPDLARLVTRALVTQAPA